MANSWQADEDEEFILHEPTFKDNSNSSYPPVPDLPPTWKRNAGLVLMSMGIFVATIVVGELASRVVAKWLE